MVRFALALFLSLLLSADALAMCDVIPGASDTYRGALGVVNRPFAIPGDVGQQVVITIDDSGCDPIQETAGFVDVSGLPENDYFISIIFEPPAPGDRNAIVLTTNTNLGTCNTEAGIAAPQLGGGSADCIVVDADTQEFDIIDPQTLHFRFPDTDAEFAPDADDRTFTGPATVVVTPSTDPLPFGLASARCADTAGLVACVDELYADNGTCDTDASDIAPVFGHFVGLPPANDFSQLCEPNGNECSGLGTELRATVDAAGHALIPVDWRAVLLRPNGIPVGRLVRGTTEIPAFTGDPTLASIPGQSFLGSYAPGGQKLPPIFTPIADPAAPGATFFGTVDAPIGVIRIARRVPDLSAFDPVYQECADHAGVPCLNESDCPSGLCGATTCYIGTMPNQTACTDDLDCAPGATCGPVLFDLSDRLLAGDGPILVPELDFTYTAEDTVSLEGLRQTESMLVSVQLEALATPATDCNGTGQDLNDDNDCTDSVVVVRDSETGIETAIGTTTGLGRAVARIRQPPFSFSALAVEDDVIAFLESEPLEGDCSVANDCDRNQDGDVFDTMLRVFRLAGGGELTQSQLVADAEPVINGQSLVVSNGQVFFRTSEVAAAAQTTARVSVDDAGTEADGRSGSAFISSDGRFVSFNSHATNLIDGNDLSGPDTNDAQDIFVHDRDFDADGVYDLPDPVETRRMNVRSSGGAQADQWPVECTTPPQEDCSGASSVSPDGRYVAFDSKSSHILGDNLDTNQVRDAFVHDRDTNNNGVFDQIAHVNTVRVSIRGDGNQGMGGAIQSQDSSGGVSMSEDGRFVKFQSGNPYLIQPPLGSSIENTFVHDRDKDADGVFDEGNPSGPVSAGSIDTVRVSAGGLTVDARSGSGSLSADGRQVFFSSGSDIVAEDSQTPPDSDLFGLDRDPDGNGIFDEANPNTQTVRLSHASDGSDVNGEMGGAQAMSPDARYVAFHSYATNMAAGDTNNAADVFVMDRDADDDGVLDEPGETTTTRVSLSSAGIQAGGDSLSPSVSADGRFVTFRSLSANLVADDQFANSDIFVHDTLLGHTMRLSIDDPIDENRGQHMSSDGRWVAFTSPSAGLVNPDVLGHEDVFVVGTDTTDGSADLSGDGILDDVVLRVVDTSVGPPATVTDLCAAGSVAVSAGRAAYLRPEAAGACGGLGPDLNGDADMDDAVVQLFDAGVSSNLGCSATAVVLSETRIAALVSEAGEATDLNADGDQFDQVVFVRSLTDSVPAICGDWTNTTVAADSIAISGDTIGVLTSEASDGNTDLNGDGDTLDQVVRRIDAATGMELDPVDDQGTPINPVAASEFVIEADLVAFRTPESDQANTDLNSDGDTDDAVMQVYLGANGRLLNSGQAAIQCRFESCNPRLPYAIAGSTVTFLTLEADQGAQDLDESGDANGIVLQLFNAQEAADAGFQPLTGPGFAALQMTPVDPIDVVAGIGAGICIDDGLPCATDADCGFSGGCFVPPGGCIQPLPTMNPDPCTCSEGAGCSDCGAGFCLLTGGTDGFCHELVGSCESDGQCPSPSVCFDDPADLAMLFTPLDQQPDGRQVFVSEALFPELTGNACTSDLQCGGGVCNAAGRCQSAGNELVVAGAADSDEDGIADPYDNCPHQPNPGQEDEDDNGVGNMCDLVYIPEPTMPLLLGCGVGALGVLWRSRHRSGARGAMTDFSAKPDR
jgi:hypothetical protein